MFSGFRTDFFKKTAVKISRAFQEDLLAERYASKDMLMQGVDARIKLATVVMLMVFTGIAASFASLVILLASAFALVILSGLNVPAFIRRVWLVIPLLLLIFSVPAATNLFIPGQAVLIIFRSNTPAAEFLRHPGGVFFTLQGIEAAARIFLRTGISISYGYILVMTTRWSQLAGALKSFKLPSVVVGILSMTYRYIFVLIQVAQEMFEARYLRTVGKIGNAENRRFVSGRIALLFVKSGNLSDEIYDAMLCRCYSGEAISLGSFKLTRNDLLWIVDFILIVLIMFIFW